MTVLTILGSVAAIIVAVVTIWNTATFSRLRLRVRAARHARRERKRQAESIKRFGADPALREIEDRFDELHDAYTSKDVPYELRVVWTKVFRLAGEAPVRPPFQYRALVLQSARVSLGHERSDHLERLRLNHGPGRTRPTEDSPTAPLGNRDTPPIGLGDRQRRVA